MEWINDVIKLFFQFNNGIVVIKRIFIFLGSDAEE